MPSDEYVIAGCQQLIGEGFTLSETTVKHLLSIAVRQQKEITELKDTLGQIFHGEECDAK